MKVAVMRQPNALLQYLWKAGMRWESAARGRQLFMHAATSTELPRFMVMNSVDDEEVKSNLTDSTTARHDQKDNTKKRAVPVKLCLTPRKKRPSVSSAEKNTAVQLVCLRYCANGNTAVEDFEVNEECWVVGLKHQARPLAFYDLKNQVSTYLVETKTATKDEAMPQSMDGLPGYAQVLFRCGLPPDYVKCLYIGGANALQEGLRFLQNYLLWRCWKEPAISNIVEVWGPEPVL